MDQTRTDRRSFLKTGALAAAPLAVAAPVASLADDGTRAELERLKDRRDIEALHRAALRRINGSELAAAHLAKGLRSLSDSGDDGDIEVAQDGLRATSRHAVSAELETAFAGDSTLEKMARFQGQGSHRHSEPRVLTAQYVKEREGWRIADLRLA